MIIYRPSGGNNVTPVDIDTNGNWLGESLGAELVKEKALRVFPFTKVDSKLISTDNTVPGSQSSNWFFKSITDFDFIRGATTYRCIYIGCESDDPSQVNFSEYIDNIAASVAHTVPTVYPPAYTQSQADTYLNSSLSLSLWYEGKYNIFSSKNTFVATDELDSHNDIESLVTASARPWAASLSFNEYLKPGEYLKIWIKRDCSKDKTLIDFSGFTYTFTINDLVIKNIEKSAGRLNVSKVYSGDLSAPNEIDLKELLSLEVQYKDILKIVDIKDLSNIFYVDTSNNIHNLIIKNYGSISQNKFIDYDFSSVTGAISGNANYAFSRVVECLNGNIQYFGEIKNELRYFLNTKFIIDILPSNKDDIQNCYIFYNELVSDSTDPLYEVKYNHTNYSWNFGVIKLDLSFSNESEFADILSGYNNKRDISITDTVGIFTLKKDYFASSVILQDDLFTIVGYEIEDCKIDNKKTYINYLWEKDIILNVPSLTTSFVPKTKSTEITTVENDGKGEAYLIFNDLSKVNNTDFNSTRQINFLNDGKEYLKMSSPHEKEIKIGTGSVSYDAVEKLDDMSYTIAFNIEESSINTSHSTSIIGETNFNDTFPPHKHLLLDSVYKDYSDFKPVYNTETIYSYAVQEIRQDAIQVQDLNPYSEVIPLTGNQYTSPYELAYLQEILTPKSIANGSRDFGRLVKLSGDGDTAVIVVPNYNYTNSGHFTQYNVITSKVLIYRRCGLQWVFIREIVPKSYGIFNIDVFLEIPDEEKIDINYDGTQVVISSRANSSELGTITPLGKQFNYNGYVVRTYATLNGWKTYSQQVIEATNLLPDEQITFASSYDFGYSVSFSSDASILLIGSPGETFSYKQYDSQGVLLNKFDLSNNGAAYLVTTHSLTAASLVDISASLGLTPSSPLWNPILDLNQDGIIDAKDLNMKLLSLPNRDYIYGDDVSGSNWNFVYRFIPSDASDMKVGGISYKDCLANGFQGKRYGERVRLNTDGRYIAISAKYDSQLYLNGGAVYMYSLPSYDTNCIATSLFKEIKVFTKNEYLDMNFSGYAMELSKDGSTLFVGCPNELSQTGLAHLFNTFDWSQISQYPYKEVVIVDPEPMANGNFGVGIKLNQDASILFIKNNFFIKQLSGEDFSYQRRYFEFNKIPNPLTESGNSFDISDDATTVIIGIVRTDFTEDNRVFIFDEHPEIKNLVVSVNCPTTGTSGTPGSSATSGSPANPIIISDLYSIPIYYLTEVNYIPTTHDIQVLVDELLPQTIIGLERQSKVYKDSYMGVLRLHCNGNQDVYALDITYNFFQKEWVLNYFNNKAQQVTVDILESGIILSPNYTNVITVNTTRKQVNGYYCGKRYFINFEICVNGRSLFKDSSYTFDTTNTYTTTFNQTNSFSAGLTYIEVRDYLEKAEVYNKALSIIYSNVYWAKLETEHANTHSERGFENFIYKRQISFNSLPWENKETIVVPIVLQGNAYSVDSKYNTQITRSLFDFSKIDTASPSFAFGYEGGSKPLSWIIDDYDSDKDTMVIWVKLEEWNGQKLVLYYGDLEYIKTTKLMNPFDECFATWRMIKLTTINRLRYDNTMVYNGGEAIIVSQNDSVNTITQIDKQYMLGNANLYKSNKFDVAYDDSGVRREREQKVKDFIATNVKLFAPGFMEIRDIVPLNDLLVESNSIVGENNGK